MLASVPDVHRHIAGAAAVGDGFDTVLHAADRGTRDGARAVIVIHRYVAVAEIKGVNARAT